MWISRTLLLSICTDSTKFLLIYDHSYACVHIDIWITDRNYQPNVMHIKIGIMSIRIGVEHIKIEQQTPI
jgi:hypothetical protein